MSRLQTIYQRVAQSSNQRLGFVAIAVAATLWAIGAIAANYLFSLGVSPVELTTVRAVIAAGGLALLQPWSLGAQRWLDWRILALGASLALVTITYYLAIDRLPVAVAVVIQYTAPVLVLILTALRTQCLPSLTTIVAALIALLGVMLVSGVGRGSLGLDSVGLMAAAASAFFFATYTLLSEALVDHYGAMGVMFRGFVLSSLFWLGIQITQGIPTAILQPITWPGLAFVGIGGTLIPFCLLCWGIQKVQATRGAIAATLEPVMAAIFAWIGLGQSLTSLQLLGGFLVVTAVTLLQR